jgi:acetolactate synthase-1/3 small subunit
MDPTVSRITLVTTGDDGVLAQIIKQLNKLVPVIRVSDFKDTAHVDRELVLVKVSAEPAKRGELMSVIDIFRGKVIDVGPESYVIEITGGEGKIEAILEMLRPLGILEIVRTGRVAMFRGIRTLRTTEGKEKVA